MAFDIKTVPLVIIKNGTSNNVVISNPPKEPHMFYLHQNNKQLMVLNTKTNREIKELYSSYDLAYGDVLVSGLGFGILPLWLASKPEVKLVDIAVTDENIALNVLVSFLDLAQRRGVFSIDESSKIWECVKMFQKK